MKEWFQKLFTWDFWLTVVIVAIITNLVAAYLKNPLDRLLGKLSRFWATRNARVREEREKRIQLLKESGDMRAWMISMSLHRRVQAMMHAVGGMFVMLLGLGTSLFPPVPAAISRFVLGLFAGWCWVSVFGNIIQTTQIMNEVHEATKSLLKDEQVKLVKSD